VRRYATPSRISVSLAANNGKLEPEANFLALSGGGGDGAFSAGILCGWTAAGTRPRFKLVKFKTNKDGSVDLYLQNASPGKDKEANWLPAPKGKFVLMFRLYWPYEPPHVSILDGSWKPPAVKLVK